MKKNVFEGKLQEMEILACQGKGRALKKLLPRAGI